MFLVHASGLLFTSLGLIEMMCVSFCLVMSPGVIELGIFASAYLYCL